MTLLHLDNITLHFPTHAKPILDHIHYEIKQGDFIILLGSNGSGKSSLLKLLTRHYQASSGVIYFLGKPISDIHHQIFSQQVGVITQDCSHSLFPSLTLFENYQLIKSARKKFLHTRAEKKYLEHYLAEFNPNLANKFNLLVEQLSGGEKQALLLALSLLQPPTLLLLDEHTSALDPNTSAQLMQLTKRIIEQYNITCILTTHDLNIALQYGNRILILHDGKIVKTIEGKAKQLLSRESLLKQYQLHNRLP